MHEMTAANLRSAHAGESMAHMRYIIWSEKAQMDGFANVARLFRAISRAEQAHATGHFKALAGVAGAFSVSAGGGFGYASTAENLASAIEGETFEINEMYPAYLAVAKLQKEPAATKSMSYAMAAEKIHAEMYKKAKKAVDAGKDVELGPVRICQVCGHTLEGQAPDFCPTCGAKKDEFITFE